MRGQRITSQRTAAAGFPLAARAAEFASGEKSFGNPFPRAARQRWAASFNSTAIHGSRFASCRREPANRAISRRYASRFNLFVKSLTLAFGRRSKACEELPGKQRRMV
jgi:hypothetical protein